MQTESESQLPKVTLCIYFSKLNLSREKSKSHHLRLHCIYVSKLNLSREISESQPPKVTLCVYFPSYGLSGENY